MEALNKLVGKKITKIRMDEEFLVFETDDSGVHAFTVEGDCCSHSYFFDFYGVRQLLEGGKVTSTEEVELSPGDPRDVRSTGSGVGGDSGLRLPYLGGAPAVR